MCFNSPKLFKISYNVIFFERVGSSEVNAKAEDVRPDVSVSGVSPKVNYGFRLV